MEIKTLDIHELHNDPANARKHDAKNIAAITASLVKFGQVEPLVVQASSHIVIGGNGRLEAMRALGWAKANVVEVDLDATQAAALGIALNRSSELATWDEETLGKLLQGLREDGMDLGELGFDVGDMDALFEKPKDGQGAKEMGEGEFSEFECTCPRCGFEFDNDGAAKNRTVESY